MSYGIDQDMPRIRGQLAKIKDPPEDRGKWVFEISIWTFDGETKIGKPIGPFGPYDTEKLAGDAMMSAIKMICDTTLEHMGHEPSDKYLDLKNGGIMRPWTEQ